MNKTKKLNTALLILLMVFALILSGCGEKKSGNTIDEPEITADYLEGDYAQQLLTDGAETMLGFVDMTKTDGSYSVSVTEKESVSSAAYDEGYYLADTNVVTDLTLGLEQRIACLEDGKLQVVTPEEFIKDKDKYRDQLFTVYMMGTSAELILGTDPADVAVK